MTLHRSIILTISLLFATLVAIAAPGKDKLRAGVSKLARKLDKEKQIHFGNPVGYSARRETNNKYYKLYRRLKEKATNEELVTLTKSRSTILLVYSFSILRSRNYDSLQNIFFEHIKDTTWFWTAGGCTGVLDTVNRFMLFRLRPTEATGIKNYFTKEEFEKYLEQFKKDYPSFW